MGKSKYIDEYRVDIDRCGPNEKLGLIGACNIIQSLATRHAYELGIGAFDMETKGAYWVITNTQIEFYNDAILYETLTGETWPARTKPTDYRTYRNIVLKRKKDVVVKAKSEWVILSKTNNMPVQFKDAGFPEKYKFIDEVAIPQEPSKFINDFDENDKITEYTIQTSDLDLAVHTNNVKYVQMIVNTLSVDELKANKIKTFEIKYVASCLLGDKVSIYRKIESNTYRYAIKNGSGKVMTYALIAFK